MFYRKESLIWNDVYEDLEFSYYLHLILEIQKGSNKA
jgi:hypothetical protein